METNKTFRLGRGNTLRRRSVIGLALTGLALIDAACGSVTNQPPAPQSAAITAPKGVAVTDPVQSHVTTTDPQTGCRIETTTGDLPTGQTFTVIAKNYQTAITILSSTQLTLEKAGFETQGEHMSVFPDSELIPASAQDNKLVSQGLMTGGAVIESFPAGTTSLETVATWAANDNNPVSHGTITAAPSADGVKFESQYLDC